MIFTHGLSFVCGEVVGSAVGDQVHLLGRSGLTKSSGHSKECLLVCLVSILAGDLPLELLLPEFLYLGSKCTLIFL